MKRFNKITTNLRRKLKFSHTSFNSAIKVPIDMNDAINNLYKSIFSSIIRIKSTICPSPLPQPVLCNKSNSLSM